MIANVRRWVEATEQRADQYLFQPLPDIVKDIIIIVDFIANTIRFEVCFGGRWRRERRRAGKKIRLEERLAEKRYSRPTRERYLWREKRYADGAVKDMAGKKIRPVGRAKDMAGKNGLLLLPSDRTQYKYPSSSNIFRNGLSRDHDSSMAM